MNQLFAKLSSYNIFNNLLPGALFCTAASYLGLFSLDKSDLLGLAVAYYFSGLVIGRVGSVVIEPILRYLRIIPSPSYDDFVRAVRDDEKLETLVETNNTYRAILSFYFCLAIAISAVAVQKISPVSTTLDIAVVLILLLVLFIVAYRKQSIYIDRRINIDRSSQEGAAKPQKPSSGHGSL